jgi:hypothetical protein
VDTATAIARRVGIALFAGTLALVVSSFAWPAVLVLGDRVTSAGDAAVALLGCGLLVGLLSRVLAVVDRRRGRGRSVPDAEGARRARSGRRLAVVLLVVGAGAGAAFSWALDSGSTSAVLAPASANGCRVVVEEHSFLMGGSGSVFVLPAGAVVARRSAGTARTTGIDRSRQGRSSSPGRASGDTSRCPVPGSIPSGRGATRWSVAAVEPRPVRRMPRSSERHSRPTVGRPTVESSPPKEPR